MTKLEGFLPNLSLENRPSFSLLENIVSQKEFSQIYDYIKKTTERTENLVKPEGEDWRDPWLAAQTLLGQEAILEFITENKNEGGIILLLGTMGSGKTSLLFRTTNSLKK